MRDKASNRSYHCINWHYSTVLGRDQKILCDPGKSVTTPMVLLLKKKKIQRRKKKLLQ